MPAVKKQQQKKDLANVADSMTRYIYDHADELRALEKSNNKKDLVAFVDKAKESGISISPQKYREMITNINKGSYLNGYRYLYNFYLAGRGDVAEGVIKGEGNISKDSNLRNTIVEIVREALNEEAEEAEEKVEETAQYVIYISVPKKTNMKWLQHDIAEAISEYSGTIIKTKKLVTLTK